jgi:hypothetical protein
MMDFVLNLHSNHIHSLEQPTVLLRAQEVSP